MATLDWRVLQQDATIVDLHVHPSLQQQLFQRNLNLRYFIDRTIHASPWSCRASFPRLHQGGYDVIFSAVYVPERGLIRDFPILQIIHLLRPCLWRKLFVTEPYDATRAFMLDMEAAAAASATTDDPAQMAGCVADLNAILAQPKGTRPIAIIHAIEGGHSLGSEAVSDADVLDHVQKLFDAGVSCIALAHFYPNQVAHPCYPFPEDVVKLARRKTLWRDLTLGLTSLGRQVVQKMIDLGMLIDLSHCSPAARQEVYDLVDASGTAMPLVATHVGAYSINPSPYNLTDDEIRRIARDGGVVGVIFMPYWLMPKESGQGLNFISRHIQYLIDMGGEDIVGIGTDFDGFSGAPDDLDNAAMMDRLIQRLIIDGHSAARIQKILGGNALRMIRQGWHK